ncbi:hypothetical protein [Streptomyces sp. NBC_01262]|uniref:hypothetical protein n=1 Tax=Streptomyces sp. NBC_01262 TaxID=2903803 RepID=UPI002E3343D4|nr:hypothetical protein [Streptomyces sp. NBC_01262]
MASIRTARVLAAMAALPLAAALFTGTAMADNGAIAGNVGGSNFGSVTTTQQAARGAGASNQNNTASVVGSAFTSVDQSNVNVRFSPLW